MEKVYKIRHIPTGKYLSKSVSANQNKWGLGPKGKAWSKKLPSLIKGGVLIGGKLIPESEFEFIEFVVKQKTISEIAKESLEAELMGRNYSVSTDQVKIIEPALLQIIKDSLIKEIEVLKDTKKYGDDTYNCAWRDGNNSAIENVIAIIKEFKVQSYGMF